MIIKIQACFCLKKIRNCWVFEFRIKHYFFWNWYLNSLIGPCTHLYLSQNMLLKLCCISAQNNDLKNLTLILLLHNWVTHVYRGGPGIFITSFINIFITKKYDLNPTPFIYQNRLYYRPANAFFFSCKAIFAIITRRGNIGLGIGFISEFVDCIKPDSLIYHPQIADVCHVRTNW